MATLQETHVHVADLVELLKVFQDCKWTGTFADSPNAGGTSVLLRRSFAVEAVSVVYHPIEVGRSPRVMVDFQAGSLNLVAMHSDPAQVRSCVAVSCGFRSARAGRVLALWLWRCATSMSPCLEMACTMS